MHLQIEMMFYHNCKHYITIWKWAPAKCFPPKIVAALSPHLAIVKHLLAASTGRVTCNQNIAQMCCLITASPCCRYTDRLHLSERCHDAAAEIRAMMPSPAGRGNGRCTGALKQMLSTINPPLIMLTLPDINLLRPVHSRSDFVMKCCNLLPFSPPNLLVCICFSYWFSQITQKQTSVCKFK